MKQYLYQTVLLAVGDVNITLELMLFVVVGFVAQAIDGALGMAYGVSSNSLLLAMGIPAPVASASVHLAEIATTGVSGISHFKLGNIDKGLVKKLVIPGVFGSAFGAIILSVAWTNIFDDGKTLIKLGISMYLLLMGLRIIYKALNHKKEKKMSSGSTRVGMLAVVGGFFDAIGGGGWGPIVTSTLLSKGYHPRYTIGSVNIAEFFVTVVQVIVFVSLLQIMDWQLIVGLIIGGCFAAPFAARLCSIVSVKKMMFIVGSVIVGLQIYSLMTNIPKLLH